MNTAGCKFADLSVNFSLDFCNAVDDLHDDIRARDLATHQNMPNVPLRGPLHGWFVGGEVGWQFSGILRD